MRVAINAWFWHEPYTGSGQYVRNLVHGLRQIAPEVELILIVPGGSPPVEDAPEGVAVRPAGRRGGHLSKTWFEQRGFPAAAKRAGADVAHVPYWGGPLQTAMPLVVSVLDVIPLALPAYGRGLLPGYYVSLQVAAARGATHLITISEFSKSDIVRRIGVPAEQVTVTPLAADARFHPKIGAEGDVAIRQRYDLPDRYVLYFGGYDMRKRVAQLVAAFTYVAGPLGDEVALVLAGRTPPWREPLFPDIPAAVRSVGLDKTLVRFIGPVDAADQPGVYRLADVFAFPSFYEGFGLPVLEAMACGVPVVANQIPVIEEVAGDAAYLTADGDSRAMGAALLSLLIDEPLRQDLSTRGLARATHFNWRKTAAQTLDVYRRVSQL